MSVVARSTNTRRSKATSCLHLNSLPVPVLYPTLKARALKSTGLVVTTKRNLIVDRVGADRQPVKVEVTAATNLVAIPTRIHTQLNVQVTTVRLVRTCTGAAVAAVEVVAAAVGLFSLLAVLFLYNHSISSGPNAEVILGTPHW